jgi:beta-lactamase superfamily II metal-dependent hydrolase
MNRSIGFTAIGIAAIALVPGAAIAQPPATPLSLHFMDVGQGDGTLVTCPNGATILIDSGSLPLQAATQTRVRNYVLREIGPLGGDIDYLILSHPDTDHYNLIRPVLAGVPIGRGYYAGARTDYSDPTIFDFMRTTPRTSVHLAETDFDREATPNPDIDCGDADVWILAAGVQSGFSHNNAMSIVVMVRMGDFEAVITGDATRDTESTILRRYTPTFLDVDVLRVGHHGSLATSTTPAWASALSPALAIFSAGSTNSFGHPRTEVVARLTPHTTAAPAHPFRDAARVSGRHRFTTHPAFRENAYATATSGNIVVRTTGTGFTVLTNQ